MACVFKSAFVVVPGVAQRQCSSNGNGSGLRPICLLRGVGVSGNHSLGSGSLGNRNAESRGLVGMYRICSHQTGRRHGQLVRLRYKGSDCVMSSPCRGLRENSSSIHPPYYIMGDGLERGSRRDRSRWRLCKTNAVQDKGSEPSEPGSVLGSDGESSPESADNASSCIASISDDAATGTPGDVSEDTTGTVNGDSPAPSTIVEVSSESSSLLATNSAKPSGTEASISEQGTPSAPPQLPSSASPSTGTPADTSKSFFAKMLSFCDIATDVPSMGSTEGISDGPPPGEGGASTQVESTSTLPQTSSTAKLAPGFFKSALADFVRKQPPGSLPPGVNLPSTSSSDHATSDDTIAFRTASDFLKFFTPLRVAKYGAISLILWSLLSLLLRAVSGVVFNPSVLMYSSWLFVEWPWPTAIALAIWAWRIATKQKQGKAKEWEQVVLLGSALTWLILVPCGIFQGYVDGWPLFLFFFYFLFFSISAIYRLQRYGDLSPRAQDKQWATKTSRGALVAFVTSVVAGHWFAAREALYLERSILQSNAVAFLLLLAAFRLHWVSTFFLGKYFDRLVVPQEVVKYGPYRWVRHPIYTSYMMLFVGYCVALRSYLSGLFLLVACAVYYSNRVRLEEELLEENFGEEYREYKGRVTKRFLPYLI